MLESRKHTALNGEASSARELRALVRSLCDLCTGPDLWSTTALRSKQRFTVWAMYNEMARRCAGTPGFHETGPLGADWLKLRTKNFPSVPESVIQHDPTRALLKRVLDLR